MKIDDLREQMCIPANETKPSDRFERIADALINEFAISYMDEKYRILELEFYFYNKNHKDITVHPRKSDALCWYINDFGGIDLNFESKIERVVTNGPKYIPKYVLTDDSYFGGILIRKVQRVSDKVDFDGPLKVAELFRILDATSVTQKTPLLVEYFHLEKRGWERLSRHKILGSHKGDAKEQVKKKVNYNLQQCFVNVFDDDTKCNLEKLQLEKFRDAKYGYHIK